MDLFHDANNFTAGETGSSHQFPERNLSPCYLKRSCPLFLLKNSSCLQNSVLRKSEAILRAFDFV